MTLFSSKLLSILNIVFYKDLSFLVLTKNEKHLLFKDPENQNKIKINI